VEVVELRHERSRSLDPHKHRQLWLNVKVRGVDGKWSNVDTRVALRFQNVINAEGDLAARTDPSWITALAEKGFTLDADGEIAQLQHLVRPLSKRSAQIEANKANRTRWWKEQHPGQEPSRDVLNQIDRWAWAAGRPDKPGRLDEDTWAYLVRDELVAADPKLGHKRQAADVAAVATREFDLELLAAKAIVDADARSTGTGGRFSVLDVRAGAIRAVAASGVIANRSALESVLDDVTATALAAHTVTLVSEPDIPDHVKRLMATSVAALKATLARRVAALAAPGKALQAELIAAIASALDPERELDAGQIDGAASIAGTASIVAITGAAGTGKTTMLRVAGAALRRLGRNMIIVAPTKKAASVAGRETESDSSSLHQLLHDQGWRWASNTAGSLEWTRLLIGDRDPNTGRAYDGPQIRIRAGDRIVVDEAGMLDLESANALLDVLGRTHASLAVVGDDYQALPVGHSGAMALFRRAAFAQVELTAIHRFHDPDWAEFTARLRDADGAGETQHVADELIQTGHVAAMGNEEEARQAMVDAWFDASRRGQSIALVTATHAEAQQISEAIQGRRIQSGAVSTEHSTAGQNGQAIFVGDIVQTRRNNSIANVENRQSWIVKNVTADHVELASNRDLSNMRRITHEYASSCLHLGYATTVYGVQGETTDRSVVGPGVDAAGLYVGLTRGRLQNDVIVVSTTPASARSELAATMQRHPAEETIEKSRAAAQQELNRASRAGAMPVEAAKEARSRSLAI
jgi:hypothetical protein